MSKPVDPSFIAIAMLSFGIGYWISGTSDDHALKPETSFEPPRKETIHKPDRNYDVPRFTFSEPFDLKKELRYALALEDPTERYGRLFAIGYQSAQNNPEKNLEILSPEIWDYHNYDLRGTFHSEWMRLNPDSFLAYAEEKYTELTESHLTKLFPVYHLSYMEPLALLELLPRFTNTNLKNRARNDILGTLIEVNPTLLWENRTEIASTQEIVREASNKGLYPLALEFWQLSGWEDLYFTDELHSHMAKNELLDFATHLSGYQKTQFAIAYSLENPSAAAKWVRSQAPLVDIDYEFTPKHAAFFRHLFATERFSDWPDAAAWLCESISADQPANNNASIFSAIKKSPKACHQARMAEELAQYLGRIENRNSIKKLYLSIENDHPILNVLEQFMLKESDKFTDAIVARTTREAPTPERLMKVLEMGNLDSWPEQYFAAARDTIDSLSESDLQWGLSPSMILSAQEVSPDRIQNLLASADSNWLSNTLNSSEFYANATIKHLDVIPELLRDLPTSDAQAIIESARSSILRNSLHENDKAKYLRVAQNQKEALLVAKGINVESYLQDDQLRNEIAQNPHKQDIYLAIANNSQFSHEDAKDPNLKQALERIESGRELSRKDTSTIISAIQSLPSSERFLTAKAMLMANEKSHGADHSESLFNLPFWSESEVEQLKSLNFTHLINLNIDNHSDFIW